MEFAPEDRRLADARRAASAGKTARDLCYTASRSTGQIHAAPTAVLPWRAI